MPIRWIHAGRVRHYRSQSIYHGLAYAQTPQTPNTVVVSIPEDPYLCIGYFQEAAKEVDLDFCKAQKLPVIRRETGGGTVYIDSGQVFVQWICQPGFLPRKVEHRFQHFNKAMVETYSFFGIQAYHHPINDVHVDGKKIVGTGAATIGNAEVVTGNFMFDFNTEIMARALKVPNELFRSAIKSSLDNYITWMSRELVNPPSYEEVIRQYKLNCAQLLGFEMAEGDFTAEELGAIAKVEERLQQEGWLHSVKASSSRNRLVKIHAGVWVGWMSHEAADMSVQVFSQIRNDTLEMIRIFLPESVKPAWATAQLEQALVSASMFEEEIGERLKEFFSQVDENDRLMPMRDWTNAVMSIKKEVQKVSGHA
jgi:lipoate---protein ligase